MQKKKSVKGISKKTLKTMDQSMTNFKRDIVSKPIQLRCKRNISQLLANNFVMEQHYDLRRMGICIQPVDTSTNTVSIYIKKPCKIVLTV